MTLTELWEENLSLRARTREQEMARPECDQESHWSWSCCDLHRSLQAAHQEFDRKCVEVALTTVPGAIDASSNKSTLAGIPYVSHQVIFPESVNYSGKISRDVGVGCILFWATLMKLASIEPPLDDPRLWENEGDDIRRCMADITIVS